MITFWLIQIKRVILFSMKQKRLLVTLSLLIIVILSGCASIGGVSSGEINEIIGMINSGESDILISMSSEPFLVDGEVLPGVQLNSMFWNGLKSAGFRIENPVLLSAEKFIPGTSRWPSESKAAELFLQKYPDAKARLAVIGCDSGTVYLLTGKDVEGAVKIYAWGGPVR